MPEEATGQTAAPMPELTLDECRALLRRQRLCTMSVVDGEEPYGVPLFYGFDGTTLHLGLAEGRKTRALDANPRVCITVVEVGPGDEWASVQVSGVAEWVSASHREESIRVLIAHNRRLRDGEAEAGATSRDQPPMRRHAGGRILRVATPSISGRRRH